MGQLAELIEGFNIKITDNPGKLPKKLYVLELTEGPVYHLDGRTDRLVEGLPKEKPDCTIKSSADALSTLLNDPSKGFGMVLKGQIKFDDMPSMMALAQALSRLL